MRLIYGTGNAAKLRHMREMLAELPLEIVGIGSVTDTLPVVDESGSNPLENASIKAEAYYSLLHAPVFSCDSGLYIQELPDARQPGVHVRTIGGRSLTDDEMIQYYAAIAKEFDGTCHARYRNAICLQYDAEHVYRSMDDGLAGDPFILTAAAHEKRREGFPLDSLSVDIASGQYYYDLDAGRISSTALGFQRFFRSVLRDLGML